MNGTPRFIQRETVRLVIRAVNTLLAAHNAGYLVEGDDVTITRRGGYTVIALREMDAGGPEVVHNATASGFFNGH